MDQRVKIIFLDIDGTLVVSGCEASRMAIDAIQQVRKNGHKVYLSTGRPISSVSTAVKKIPVDGGIYSAGRHVIAGEEILSDKYMSMEAVRLLQDVLLDLKAKRSIESSEGVFVDPYDDSWGITYDEWLRFRNVICGRNAVSMEQFNNNPTYKMVFISPSEACVDQIRLAVSELQKNKIDIPLNIVVFGKMVPGIPLIVGEISDPSVNKGSALLEICDHYQIDPEDTIAFGDSMNDAPIILQAGIGVAMANSEHELMEIADWTCGRVEEDGIVEAFRQLELM